tara:strand:- start:712849 stop:713589 length:741 start_codon:yes stop_codon:yes gene_type:complete
MNKCSIWLVLVVFCLGAVSIAGGLVKGPLALSDTLETEPLKSSLSFYVVDLDGDGIELIPLAESNVYFDVDGDGLAERTEWLSADDGFVMVRSTQERELASIVGRIYHAFTNHREKLEEFDKDSNYVYDKNDFLHYGRGETSQELGFSITHDKKSDGIPETGGGDQVECALINADYTPNNAEKTIILTCKDKAYTVHEINFNYEDINRRWDLMCLYIEEYGRGEEKSIGFYKKNCNTNTIKQGEHD